MGKVKNAFGQSDCKILVSTRFQGSIDESTWFLYLKMLLADQIAGFINQPYLYSKWVKQHDFLRTDIDWKKENLIWKYVAGWGQKCYWSIILQNF